MRLAERLILLALLTFCSFVQAQDMMLGRNGSVSFKSTAPLEIISAESNELRGVLNQETGEFAFTVPMHTFQGFNNAVQRTHFLENYIEYERFPTATFTGRVIEDLSVFMSDEARFRAKGTLDLHGVRHERIIAVTLKETSGVLSAHARFTVILAEYGITVPKIVHQKVADTIHVTVALEMHRNE